MDDPGGVGEGQRLRHRASDLGGPFRLEPSFLLQHLGQGPAGHVLHHDVVHAVVRAGVVDTDHAGVVQAGYGLGLAAEPSHEGLVACVLGGQDLDGHGPAQDGVGALVHLGHAAAPHGAVDVVALA